MNIIKLNSQEKNISLPKKQGLLIIENDINNMPAERNFEIAKGVKVQYVLLLPRLAGLEKIIRRFNIKEGAILNTYYLFLDQKLQLLY